MVQGAPCSMADRIASIVPYLIPADATPHPWWTRKPYVLVRVETKDGVIGWGECHVSTFQVDDLVSMVQSLAPTLVNQPAEDVRALVDRTFSAFDQERPGFEAYSAFAGVEIALWDVLGKRLGSPVYELLGGSVRDSVSVYANIYSPHPQRAEDFADMASSQVEAGYRAIKLYPFTTDTRIPDGVAILQAVRDAVGSEVQLAVDLWRHADVNRAVEIARAIEPFDLLWIEDPFVPTDAAGLRMVRDAIRQPLLTGEILPTRREFAPIFDERAVDIVNPDICLSGLLEIQAIAAMAEPAQVKVSPHNSNSMALGTAAAVHVAMGLPNLDLIEYFPLFETALDDICDGRLLVEKGSIAKPTGPGLGLEFDETMMRRYRV